MAQLTLQFKDLALKEFELTGQSMTMGREPDNDIIVENLLVSGYHARIDPAGREYILTDLQSKKRYLCKWRAGHKHQAERRRSDSRRQTHHSLHPESRRDSGGSKTNRTDHVH